MNDEFPQNSLFTYIHTRVYFYCTYVRSSKETLYKIENKTQDKTKQHCQQKVNKNRKQNNIILVRESVVTTSMNRKDSETFLIVGYINWRWFESGNHSLKVFVLFLVFENCFLLLSTENCISSKAKPGYRLSGDRRTSDSLE